VATNWVTDPAVASPRRNPQARVFAVVWVMKVRAATREPLIPTRTPVRVAWAGNSRVPGTKCLNRPVNLAGTTLRDRAFAAADWANRYAYLLVGGFAGAGPSQTLQIPVPRDQIPCSVKKFPCYDRTGNLPGTPRRVSIFFHSGSGPESKFAKFPVFSLLIREFRHGDWFASDCTIRQRVCDVEHSPHNCTESPRVRLEGRKRSRRSASRRDWRGRSWAANCCRSR
jgi:hypothetical protein